MDRVDGADQQLGIAHRLGGHQHLHLIVKGHDRQSIALSQFTGQEARCLAGIAELLPAHGARAVNDQCQVQGRPRTRCQLWRHVGSGNGDQQIKRGGAIGCHRRP